jgi:hypothetical protein
MPIATALLSSCGSGVGKVDDETDDEAAGLNADAGVQPLLPGTSTATVAAAVLHSSDIGVGPAALLLPPSWGVDTAVEGLHTCTLSPTAAADGARACAACSMCSSDIF